MLNPSSVFVEMSIFLFAMPPIASDVMHVKGCRTEILRAILHEGGGGMNNEQ